MAGLGGLDFRFSRRLPLSPYFRPRGLCRRLKYPNCGARSTSQLSVTPQACRRLIVTVSTIRAMLTGFRRSYAVYSVMQLTASRCVRQMASLGHCQQPVLQQMAACGVSPYSTPKIAIGGFSFVRVRPRGNIFGFLAGLLAQMSGYVKICMGFTGL